MAITPDNWRRKFLEAEQLPETASSAKKAKRGRDFEAMLVAMLDEAKLEPRISFRPPGEEVDGSFWLYGRTVLFEAKWTAASHPASSIYQFKGKVDGKLVGTLGLFISINGFSPDAVDALVAGKEKNIILADGADIRAIADGRVGVEQALYRKLRVAGEKGAVFWPAVQPLPESKRADPSSAPSERQHIVVVEGRSDVQYLETAREALGFTAPITFVPAGGPGNMIPLISALMEGAPAKAVVTVIVDGDLSPAFRDKMRKDVSTILGGSGALFTMIAAEPDLETVLGLNPEGVPFGARGHLRPPTRDYLVQALSARNLRARAKANAQTRSILDVISGEMRQLAPQQSLD